MSEITDSIKSYGGTCAACGGPVPGEHPESCRAAGLVPGSEYVRAVPLDFAALAAYGAERARGITHTPEWDARMADLQREFDAQVAAVLERARQPDGTVILPSWTPPEVWDAITRIELREITDGDPR